MATPANTSAAATAIRDVNGSRSSSDAERDGDDRVDVGVQRHERDRQVSQRVRVCDEAADRADRRQVDQRDRRARRERQARPTRRAASRPPASSGRRPASVRGRRRARSRSRACRASTTSRATSRAHAICSAMTPDEKAAVRRRRRASAPARRAARSRRSRRAGRRATSAVSRSPSGKHASTPAIQNGDEATRTAVRPLGTHCSAPHDAAVAEHEHQEPEQRDRSPSATAAAARSPRGAHVDGQQRARERPAQPAHQRRRHRLERDRGCRGTSCPRSGRPRPTRTGQLALLRRCGGSRRRLLPARGIGSRDVSFTRFEHDRRPRRAHAGNARRSDAAAAGRGARRHARAL